MDCNLWRQLKTIGNCKGPIGVIRVDTIKKHDWNSWFIVFKRCQSIISRRVISSADSLQKKY